MIYRILRRKLQIK